MATLAIHTGQPLGHLIALPPTWLEALRTAWNLHVHETNVRREIAKANR